MASDKDCAENMLNILVVAALPPLHHRERIYLQVENNSAQCERFFAGVRLTRNIGQYVVMAVLCSRAHIICINKVYG